MLDFIGLDANLKKKSQILRVKLNAHNLILLRSQWYRMNFNFILSFFPLFIDLTRYKDSWKSRSYTLKSFNSFIRFGLVMEVSPKTPSNENIAYSVLSNMDLLTTIWPQIRLKCNMFISVGKGRNLERNNITQILQFTNIESQLSSFCFL